MIDMPRLTRGALLLAAVIGGMGSMRELTAAEPLELKAGERVVFLGDSITQGGDRPGGYVVLVREAIRKARPDAKIEVIGAGISGNRVPDLLKRLEKDVLDKDPSLVVIYIGINDVWHSTRGRGTPKDEYEAGLNELVERIEAAGAKVMLATPSVIGEKTDGGNDLDQMLDEYAAISRRVAEKHELPVLDLRKRFLAHLKEANPKQQASGILTTDGVHLNPAGNRFVADAVLESLGVSGKKSTQGGDGQLLRHVVLFQFKESATPEQVQEVVDAFAALPDRIDAIEDFEWGTDVSVENKAAGFTHGFVVTFKDEAGRDAYLPHPAHQEFVKLVGPRLEGVLVFDYWAKR
jgi:lysophospholipase L1-like esterase